MRKFLILVGLLISISAVAQTDKVSVNDKPVNFEYMPRINDVKLTGSIQEKFTAYKNGNPVNFIVVKKRNITVWDVELFNRLNVGEKVDLEGIVPLSWMPDTKIDAQTKQTVIAKSNN